VVLRRPTYDPKSGLLPSSEFREILSSCSNCEAFQALRWELFQAGWRKERICSHLTRPAWLSGRTLDCHRRKLSATDARSIVPRRVAPIHGHRMGHPLCLTLVGDSNSPPVQYRYSQNRAILLINKILFCLIGLKPLTWSEVPPPRRAQPMKSRISFGLCLFPPLPYMATGYRRFEFFLLINANCLFGFPVIALQNPRTPGPQASQHCTVQHSPLAKSNPHNQEKTQAADSSFLLPS